MHVYLGIKQQKHFKTGLEDNGFKRFLKNWSNRERDKSRFTQQPETDATPNQESH